VSQKYKLTIRLDYEADADLLTWVNDLKRQGYGVLSRQIKTALRVAQQDTQAIAHPALAGSDLNACLQEIRQVVEAAIASAMEGITVHQATSNAPHTEEDTAILLEALGEHLLLDDEKP